MRNLILPALILALAFQTALGEQDGSWTFTVSGDDSATITRSTATGAVTIPSVLGGYAVTFLGSGNTYDSIFGLGGNSVTSITIPNSVTLIRDWAFGLCLRLTSITIPNSVTSIGNFAFESCDGLTTLTIGSGVTNIGDYAFRSCTGLTTLTIPNSVTSIGNFAFRSCTGLTNLTIPNSVTSIGTAAFRGCSSLTSVAIGSGVTSIGNSAFADCLGLTSVTIPNSITSIGKYAFGGCHGLTSIIIPNSVTSIEIDAFRSCTGLTSITIPDSVTSIGDNAFFDCTILQRVFLPARFETTYQNFGLTSAQVSLYEPSNLAPIYLAGQQSVIANPNTHNLYTTSQIQNMAVGDLVLTRQVSGGFVLNYDIEQSTDLQTWTPYQALSLPLTGLPTDKAFVRIKAKQ